jgi:hypothetical protein
MNPKPSRRSLLKGMFAAAALLTTGAVTTRLAQAKPQTPAKSAPPRPEPMRFSPAFIEGLEKLTWTGGDFRGHYSFTSNYWLQPTDPSWFTNQSLNSVDRYIAVAVILGVARIGLPSPSKVFTTAELLQMGIVGFYHVKGREKEYAAVRAHVDRHEDQFRAARRDADWTASLCCYVAQQYRTAYSV